MALCCGKNEKIEDTSFIFSDFYGNFLNVKLLLFHLPSRSDILKKI
jgi:hypothetical protein